MKNYVIDMAESAGVTVIATETRTLRALPFRPTEDQLTTTGKAWEEWLDDIEREFRYFRISDPADRKDAMIIYGGKEIARLEKSLPDPDGNSNEYEKLRKKLNDYFAPKQNKHYARYMFLKMRPFAGEATIAYAARLREKAYDCEFGGTFDDRILEHLIQTIENQYLIQKCIAKSWELSQFLSEAGQIEDISLQVHDMKDSLGDRHIARVRVPRKQRAYRKQVSSEEEDAAMVCRYCGYDRRHTTIEDCPAYGQKCHKCQKFNHFASVCKAHRFNDENSKQKKKRIRSINELARMKKTSETDTSGSSDDDFLSKSAAHMLRIKSCVIDGNETGAHNLKNEDAKIIIQHKKYREEITQLRYEMQRQTKEIEMKLEKKLTEFLAKMKPTNGRGSCDESNYDNVSIQLKDGKDTSSLVSRGQQYTVRGIKQTGTIQAHGLPQNDWPESTSQETNSLSRSASDKEQGEDSEQEDSSFIVEEEMITNSQATRGVVRRKRKKRKGKPKN